jgi:hypothetical protein
MKRFLLTLALVVGSTVALSACEPGYKKVICHETVYVTVTKSLPYQKEVTKYDHCGKPYCVTVTCYKDIVVKVPKTVTVVKYVKVCH